MLLVPCPCLTIPPLKPSPLASVPGHSLQPSSLHCRCLSWQRLCSCRCCRASMRKAVLPTGARGWNVMFMVRGSHGWSKALTSLTPALGTPAPFLTAGLGIKAKVGLAAGLQQHSPTLYLHISKLHIEFIQRDV